MLRRSIIFVMGGVTLDAALPALGQALQRVWRIGVLHAGTPVTSAPMDEGFRSGLKALGWVDGRNVLMELRFAGGDVKRMDALMADLVAAKPDLIFAPTTSSAQAALRATHDIPIVFALPLDPVGSGLIASWARPGGNATGATSMGIDIAAKRLQLIKEVVPALSRLAVLEDPNANYNASVLEVVKRAAKDLGVGVVVLNVSDQSEIDAAFGRLARERLDGILVMDNPINYRYRQLITARAAAAGVPAIYPTGDYVDAGGFMSYGVSFVDQGRRAASYVDKIFKGAKPSELPVEQATRFELAFNSTAAKALGIKIPNSALLRADRVIE